MANPEFDQLKRLAQEVKEGNFYLDERTGFTNIDMLLGLLHEHDFLTEKQQQLIDQANINFGYKEKELRKKAIAVLKGSGHEITEQNIEKVKKDLADGTIEARYDSARRWFELYTKIEQVSDGQDLEKITNIGDWEIYANRYVDGLEIIIRLEEGKCVAVIAPSFHGGTAGKPNGLFELSSNVTPYPVDQSFATYKESWFWIREHLSLEMPFEEEIAQSIQNYIEKRPLIVLQNTGGIAA